MHDEWTHRLSDLLDGDLSAADRAALDRHLEHCLQCRVVLDELRSVSASAGNLGPRQPARDLWPGIEARLARPAARRVSFSLPAAIAAGLFIALSSGLATWVVVHQPTRPVSTATVAGSAPRQLRPVALDPAPYDRAIADLLATLRAEGRSLSPRTIETIERSLAAIDEAIADAQTALERDPTDVQLVAYLSDRQRARVAVLRQVERFAPDAE